MQRRQKDEFVDPAATLGANACPGCKCFPCKYEEQLETANTDLYELQQVVMGMGKEERKIKQAELDITDARVVDLQQKLARCKLAQSKESGDPGEVKKAARNLFKSTSRILSKKKKEAGPCMMCPIKQARIDELEIENDALKARIEELEQWVASYREMEDEHAQCCPDSYVRQLEERVAELERLLVKENKGATRYKRIAEAAEMDKLEIKFTLEKLKEPGADEVEKHEDLDQCHKFVAEFHQGFLAAGDVDEGRLLYTDAPYQVDEEGKKIFTFDIVDGVPDVASVAKLVAKAKKKTNNGVLIRKIALKGKGMGILKKALEATSKKCAALEEELAKLRNAGSGGCDGNCAGISELKDKIVQLEGVDGSDRLVILEQDVEFWKNKAIHAEDDKLELALKLEGDWEPLKAGDPYQLTKAFVDEIIQRLELPKERVFYGKVDFEEDKIFIDILDGDPDLASVAKLCAKLKKTKCQGYLMRKVAMKGKGMGIMRKAMEATVKKCNDLTAELNALKGTG